MRRRCPRHQECVITLPVSTPFEPVKDFCGPALTKRPARLTGTERHRNLNVLNLMYPESVREMGIQEARPVPGDLVRDAQRHGIETQLTRNGRPAARIARLSGTDGSAAECDKIPARTRTIPAER